MNDLFFFALDTYNGERYRNKKKYVYLFLIACCMCAIFGFSCVSIMIMCAYILLSVRILTTIYFKY